jgi:hypothetical protein
MNPAEFSTYIFIFRIATVLAIFLSLSTWSQFRNLDLPFFLRLLIVVPVAFVILSSFYLTHTAGELDEILKDSPTYKIKIEKIEKRYSRDGQKSYLVDFRVRNTSNYHKSQTLHCYAMQEDLKTNQELDLKFVQDRIWRHEKCNFSADLGIVNIYRYSWLHVLLGLSMLLLLLI